jgi:putative Holliday junction resolvase
MREPQLLLGFDFGTKNIGVASGNSLTATAMPLAPINAYRGTPEWHSLDQLVSEWTAKLMVVGLPLRMNGAENWMSRKARRFAVELRERYLVSCVMVDERLSSFVAQNEVRDANIKIRKKHQQAKQHASTHSIAACLILDAWFSLPEQEQAQLIDAEQKA